MKARTLLTFLFIAAISVITFGAQSPRGKQTFPKLGGKEPAKAVRDLTALPAPLYQSLLAQQNNVVITSIQKLPSGLFSIHWTGPAGANFQPYIKTNVLQSVWQTFGPMTTNYAITNPISATKLSIFMIAATTHETIPPGTVQWLKAPTTQAGFNCRGRAAVQDHAGNTIVAGSYQGSITFDGVTLTNGGGVDLFFVKYAPNGSLVWARRIGGALDDYANGLAVDSADNIIMVGDFSGTVDFGGTSLTYTTPVFGIAPDGFIAKYNSSGGLIWVKQLSGNSGDSGSAVTTDGSSVYVACATSSTNAALPPFNLFGPSSSDIAIAKLSSAGVPQWAIRKGGPDIDLPRSITASATEVWVSGQFQTSIDLGGGSVPALGEYDAFLAKYSAANGNYLLARIVGTSGTDIGYGCAVDVAGNVYLAGQIGGTFDFGCGQVGPGGIVIVSFNSTGNCRWSRCLNLPNFGFSPDADFASSISAEGNVFITGQVRSIISFDGVGTSSGNTTPNYFAASYTSLGAFRWSSRASAFAIGQAISGGSAAGSFSGTMTISNQTVTGPVFGTVPFAARYQP